MDIMLVFETSGGSSILSGPAKCRRKWLRSSVRQNVGLQNQMSEVQILSGSPKFGGVAQLGERLVCNQNVAGSIPVTSTMYGEREALVTSGDCKSSTLGYTGFESLALHQITVDTQRCLLYNSMKERGPDGKARDC